ncbi:hypothetical protein AAIE21_12365 [Paenibacillus sp. 102]|uniref:hypothetical protein n=1 Tax=Paenibacillus sp. 102 TaxID=3120823 RepID=UPI0031BA5758
MNYLEIGINTAFNQVARVLDRDVDKYNHGKVYMDMRKCGLGLNVHALLEGHYDSINQDFLVENKTPIFSLDYQCDKRENGFLI